MTNKVDAAHEALWTLVSTLFPNADLTRNPDAHVQPRAKTDGLAAYVAQNDDEVAEVLASMYGPVSYDLKITPLVTLVFSGKTKEERLVAARVARDALTAALAADRFLGGAVDYADIDSAPAVDGTVTWMAGGLEVGVCLLLNAPTRAG